jgi:hypothetical protein
MGRFITAKFQSACAESGAKIKKGDLIYFDGKAYGEKSTVYKEKNQVDQTFAHVMANENAYFDNFCLQNNI